MKKCPHCKKNVPSNEIFFPEYYNTLLNLNKYREDKNKKIFFNLIIKNIEKNNNIELCECFENIDEITKLYNIYVDKHREQKDNKEINEITDNYKINIIKNKLDETEFILFLKSEKKYFTCNLKNSKFIDYNELKSIIKNSHELKTELKKQDIFVIYNFKPEDTKKEFYYYDEIIIEILKYRTSNNLTTYIFFNEIKKTDTFEKLILKINDEDVKNYYLDIFSKLELSELDKSKKKNKQYEIK
jgi:hypothetical protein